MANLNAILREEIRRVALRHTRLLLEPVRKLALGHRHQIADLKRQIAALERQIKALARSRADSRPPPETEGGTAPRFDPRGLKTHRARLGLSAADYGRLVGVSTVSIYRWEDGRAKPRLGQLRSLIAIRPLGKREAHARLEAIAKPAKRPRKGVRTRRSR